jgi:hypothetical protein
VRVQGKYAAAAAVAGYTGTWVWGYLPDPTGTNSCSQLVTQYSNGAGVLETYIGPVIVNDRGSATPVTYINDLGSAATTNVLAYKYSTDQTLHWADPLADQTMANQCMMKVEMGGWMVNGIMQNFPPPGDVCAENYLGPVAAVPHLHGGEVPAEIDGSPDSWFTSDGMHFGYKYYTAGVSGNSALYKYPNVQEASPLWFHDHTLGATRLNVYAGLAGAYFIEDPEIIPVGTSTTRGTPGTCTAGCLPANLQPLNKDLGDHQPDRRCSSDPPPPDPVSADQSPELQHRQLQQGLCCGIPRRLDRSDDRTGISSWCFHPFIRPAAQLQPLCGHGIEVRRQP